MAVPEGTAKFREETSKKAGEAANRLAADTDLGQASFACKWFFASQHRAEIFAGQRAGNT
ncbi:MAG TPA: hypothetical protein VGM87_21680 [Roseomonas sp.]